MSRSVSVGMPPLHLEPSAEYTQIPSGKIVGGLYQVGGVIGVGTYGEVRYAVSLVTGERVAIKIVDLARFSVETAGLMRKEISILRMLDHRHCIRIVDVHENVPFSGRWCESCACTSFKPTDPNRGQANAHPTPTKRIPVHSETVCSVCSHAAADHSGVTYHNGLGDERDRPLFHHHHAHDDPATPPPHDEDDEEGETRQVMLIVQELAAGGELFSLLSHGGPLPEDVARLYFQQLIDGLEYLHSLSVCHRDLKPENLIISQDFELKIADFGLASLGTPVPHHADALSVGPQSTRTSGDVRHFSGVGSQPYSAPEVYYNRELYQGRGYRGEPSDLWSAAVCLFVMLTGRPPFVRPLAKTYGVHLRRCRHFTSVLAGGGGLELLHPHAKDLILALLKVSPAERLTLAEVKKHPWYNGATPSPQELSKIMEERSMRSWNSSSNPDMTHVLSRMRAHAATSGVPSASNTPVFGALSPSASPAFTIFNSPSFSASSATHSPYAAAHPHMHTRAQSPESISQRASPASFLHSHAHSPQVLSPVTARHGYGAPNLHPQVHAQSAFLPSHHHVPRHATIHSSHDGVASAAPATHTPFLAHTIASSINATSGALYPPASIEVSLLQLHVRDPTDTEPELVESEIPPPNADEPIRIASPIAVAPEYKHDDEGSVVKPVPRSVVLTSGSAPPLSARHVSALSRIASSPSHTHDVAPPGGPGPALAATFSFPPRHAYSSIRTTLDAAALRDILCHRLDRYSCKYDACGATPAAHAAAALATPLSDLDTADDSSLRVVVPHAGPSPPLVALLSVRLLPPPQKGRLVVATKLGGPEATFKQWCNDIFQGMHEE